MALLLFFICRPSNDRDWEEDQAVLSSIRADRAAGGVVESVWIKDIREQPAFYNTLTNNCSSAIRYHVNRFAAAKVPYDTRVLFPARADEFLIERGHVIGAASLEEARRLYLINGKAKEAGDDPFFSWRIRGLAPPEVPLDAP